MKINNPVPKVLLIIYIVLFIILALNPFDREVWFAENMTILPIVILLVILYWRGIRFSALSYILMSFLIFMHTIGGHYTFERVPFDYVDNVIGSARNNYDRVAHFTVGFYAFPLMEYLMMKKIVSSRTAAFFFSLFTIMSVAAAYELFEWWYVTSQDPTAGAAVLGSQGDIWDAQKDMLSDTLGGIFAAVLFLITRKKNSIQTSENI